MSDVSAAWEEVGFEPWEAEEWRRVGFRPLDAANWRDGGFGLPQAEAWRALGIRCEVATSWIEALCSVPNVRRFLDAWLRVEGRLS